MRKLSDLCCRAGEELSKGCVPIRLAPVLGVHEPFETTSRQARPGDAVATVASISLLMPLLRPSIVLRKAHGQNRSLLTRLLPVAGDVQSARHELRWLLEDCQKRVPAPEQQSLLEQYVTRRCTGEPLQYILGSVYFGELEIKCRPNVFIPRFVTA